MRKIIYTIISFFIILMLLFSVSACKTKKSVDEAMYIAKMTILKTGKSDATLIETQNYTILIDTADRESGRKITRMLNEKQIDTLDAVIITHFDSNHIGGFETVFDRINVKNVIQPTYTATTEVYEKYLESLSKKSVNVINADKNLSFKTDDLYFKIYPTNTEYENKQNESLITEINHGKETFLFTGDILTERSMDFIQTNTNTYDFIKIPNHGMYFEGEDELLRNTSPKLAVITCDDKTDTQKTDDILKEINANVFHTKDGKVEIISDGNVTKAIQN